MLIVYDKSNPFQAECSSANLGKDALAQNTSYALFSESTIGNNVLISQDNLFSATNSGFNGMASSKNMPQSKSKILGVLKVEPRKYCSTTVTFENSSSSDTKSDPQSRLIGDQEEVTCIYDKFGFHVSSERLANNYFMLSSLIDLLNIPPKIKVSITGYKRDIISLEAVKENRKIDPYYSHTDFKFNLDLTKHLISTNQLHRFQDNRMVSEPAHLLLSRFAESKRSLKQLQIEKIVHWNYQSAKIYIMNAFSNMGYNGFLEISFPINEHVVTIDNRSSTRTFNRDSYFSGIYNLSPYAISNLFSKECSQWKSDLKYQYVVSISPESFIDMNREFFLNQI
ncbi:hypothetical protein AYI70_g11338 [Smittium culicis]|uniref:Uncharacterized protein n=1 Tax=Smittium culicis TaxID=133412 RepID=A0A1R1X2B9_9FUNG|nr:hypothetical protein AYI70_g11338 [Smittium culicis]